ncbi:MAG: YciI family protein [Rhizomicrobium sp.]
MLFVITAMDKPDSLSLRAAVRPDHLEYARETGRVKLGGPFLDEKGDMIGSLVVIDAPDLEAARRWQAQDPYARAGLFARSDLHPWKATVNACGAEF